MDMLWANPSTNHGGKADFEVGLLGRVKRFDCGVEGEGEREHELVLAAGGEGRWRGRRRRGWGW